MATSLSDIRSRIERYVGEPLDNDWMIQVCNDAQAEFSLDINIQDTDQISLTTTDLSYPLPEGLKIINRLWLQSDFDAGIDKVFKWNYRTYGGNLIFTQPWIEVDTLNVDYYRNMLYFTDVDDVIDLDDRFSPLYVSYGQREWYDLPTTKKALGDAQARKEWEKHNARYLNIKQQVTSYYAIQNEPVVVDERW
jgi:hypothetical protein